MVYSVKDRRKGWLWEHRIVVLLICFAVVILGGIAVYLSLIPFLLTPVVGAAQIVSALLIIWLSMVSRSPHPNAEPTL